jgi:S-adenosylmethionine:tRNA ribosyltransferase-isomerase
MKLSQYKFHLPQELVAKFPAKNRDESRLMVLHRETEKIEHRTFKDIIDYFDNKDVMVFNDTKVFPARLYGNKEKTGAEIEVFLLRELNREQRLGEDDVLVAEVIDNTTSRGRTLRFLYDGDYDEFKKTLFELGETPLPKFIERKVEPEDKERYQTVFAKHEGAVAAPTAGMHFSRELLKRLEIKGIEFAYITLHVGLGNFRTVDVEDLTKHKMDSERIIIPMDAVRVVNAAKERKNNVCAVGTTVMRTLESSVSTDGFLKDYDGWTNKFIFPPYEFSVPNRMVSNFHLPYSTLLMMVSAFAGYKTLMHAYEVAIKEKYHFGTYGDAMLIL